MNTCSRLTEAIQGNTVTLVPKAQNYDRDVAFMPYPQAAWPWFPGLWQDSAHSREVFAE